VDDRRCGTCRFNSTIFTKHCKECVGESLWEPDTLSESDTNLEQLIREIINDELHGDRKPGKLTVWGAQSKKRIGELVADALMHTKIIVIDGRGVTTISGHKPLWK
jgi:hypothetical protein